MRRTPVLIVLSAVAWALSVVAAGCEPKPSAGRAAERLTSEQREQLLRPVTDSAWPEPESAADAPCRLQISTARPGGLHLAPLSERAESDLPVELSFEARDTAGRDTAAELSYQVLDFYGRTVAQGNVGRLTVPRGAAARRTAGLDDLKEVGWYQVVGRLKYESAPGPLPGTPAKSGELTALGGFSILRGGRGGVPRSRGLVGAGPDSVAALATRCGMGSFYAGHLIAGKAGVTNWHQRSPERRWQPAFDATALQDRVRALPLLGANLIGHIGPNPLTPIVRDKEGSMAAVGLPAEAQEFAAATAPLVELLRAVKQWDILPAELDRLAAGPGAIQHLLTVQQRAIAARRKDVRFWVSGSPSAANDVLTAVAGAAGKNDPRVAALASIHGLRFTGPDVSPEFAAWVARRAGAANWSLPVGPAETPASPQRRAWRLVKRAVTIVGAGGRARIELHPDDTVTAAAVAVMAEMLHAAAPAGRVWDELMPQRHSPVFSSRNYRVAVLWTDVPSGDKPDRGLLVIPEAHDIVAFDCMRQRVGLPQGRALVVPIGQGPVYVVSGRLSAKDLVRRLRAGRTEGLTPVDFHAECISSPVDGKATVTVHVKGLVGPVAQGTVSVEGPPGWTPRRATKKVGVGPGRRATVTFEFNKAPRRIENAYPLRIRVAIGDWSVERVQVVHEATAVEMTPKIDGDLSEWQVAAPMTVRLADGGGPPAEAAAVLVNTAREVGRSATVRVAWDNKFLYVAAEVDLAGPLARTRTIVPQRGPDGRIESAPWGPGSIQLAFEAVGAAQAQHVLAICPTAHRPSVVRLRRPGMDLRNPSAELPVEGWGEVWGAQAVIIDAGDRAVYEVAIPRRELFGLRWSRGRSWPFAFLVDAGDLGQAEWAVEAGVPPWHSSPRVFYPIGVERRAVLCRLRLSGKPANRGKLDPL